MKNYNKYNDSISSYWMDDYKDIDILTGESKDLGKDYFKLASYRRAISNFVNIVTGKCYNVKFNSTHSFTDGETVTIGANYDENSFDANVGLACHEASHILLTNFKLLGHMMDRNSNCPNSYIVLHKKYSEKDDNIYNNVKDLLNYIEDRRIDLYIFKTAPGYNGYYQAMYDKYFNSSIIDKALKSSEKRTEDWDSYIFRIINLTNKNRDINALKQLKRIYNIIDFNNIDRLKSTHDVLGVACEIYEIIINAIDINKSETNEDDAQKSDNKKDGSEDNKKDEDEDNKKDEDEDNKKDEDEDNKKDEDDTSKNNEDDIQPKQTNQPDLTPSQKSQLQKQLQKQKEFQNGTVKKSNISGKDNCKITAISESGSDIIQVGEKNNGRKVECLVVKNINKKIISSNIYKSFTHYNSWNYIVTANKGIILGKLLAKRLKIRNEERNTIYNRLAKGKIDKRLLSSLGYDNQNIFFTLQVSKFKPANIHISIDASGSMGGQKIENTIKTTIAIAKAASLIQNLNVEVTIRSIESVGTSAGMPAIFYIYNSKKDTIDHLVYNITRIVLSSQTPEGLCFEAIKNNILKCSNNTDSYFINISDGMPTYHNTKTGYEYHSEFAYNHTFKQIKHMKNNGIKVLSYFVSEYNSASDRLNFIHMYGVESSYFIDINSLGQLSKSLNEMLTDIEN